MPEVAVAFSNNDIAVVAWTFDRHLDGCLGFAIHQIDVDQGKETILPAMARFAGQTGADMTTAQAPIQKFWWKDLFARRGGTYEYLIVPMGGTPGQTLTPLSGVTALRSNRVTLTPERAPFNVYFNRGIVATQALAHALGNEPSVDALTPHIQNPSDPIRINLMGQLQDGVTSLLARADKNGGIIHAALYELNDPQGLEKQLQSNAKSRNVILGNEQGPHSDDADASNRAALKAAGVNVIDRILGKGDIPHNKFMVLSENDQPTAVLSGSTNWTSTGLCTQSNNALVIESKDVAQRYIDYWNALKADTDAADGDPHKLQSQALRTAFDHSNNAKAIQNPIDLGGGVKVELMFSPNTPGKLAKNPKTPNDMGRVFELMDGAKQAILFLAFDPGNNSILDEAGRMLAKKPDLFVRGALTNAQRATHFSEALHAGGTAEADDAAAPPGHKRGAGTVTVVGDTGQPKKQGEANGIDFRAIPAGAVTEKDAPGGWEAELAKYGFAIIHSKIVVIDPFSNDCVVVTGSHNLGFRASHNNDENMVIIHGHRGLAEAYACNVLDVYDHYAWRFLLKEHPNEFGKPLQGDDTWQERYITGADVKSAEMRFWLAAGGHAPSSAPAKSPMQPVLSSPPTAPESAVEQAPVVQQAKATTKPKTRPAAKPAGRKAAARSSAGGIAKKAAKKTAKKAAKKSSKKAAKTSKAPKKAPAKKAGKKAGKKAAKAWGGNKEIGKRAGKKKAGKKRR
ncbi:MAG TPA: phospholipase D-like domain-containing protein [Bradyrhizobium sp.]|uniref:phospholipase D-like domain-containing protein n=1 Tax=Bradyrhizobium sp. TaxID=376 RepID=UPI002D7E9950|nr:phospholipase D-like domain-containing protein [Bradyrhizobium sp.]HET7886552.1 phospholipase D-like domain-containing protein [Bradyrhizobium sp.]